MGLGKQKGSSRINRYEHQVTAVGFDNLDKLSEVLDVPAAYLLADDGLMADAILVMAAAAGSQRENLVQVLRGLAADPTLTKALLRVLCLSKAERAKAASALGLVVESAGPP
jgi:hypothetical protein